MAGDGEAVRLTEAQARVLRYADRYGPGVDFGGAGSTSAERVAARALVIVGLLRGSHRSAALTEAGRHALAADTTPSHDGGEHG